MPLLIAVLLGLSGLLVVIYPLLGLDREMSESLAAGPLAEVTERERAARDALREVEFDHRLGNLDDADYRALRTRYERRALAALKVRYQREQELDALIERQLDALRIRNGDTAGVENAEIQARREQPSTAAQRRVGGQPGSENDSTGARLASGRLARRRRGGRI
jgi:hypothetical protein